MFHPVRTTRKDYLLTDSVLKQQPQPQSEPEPQSQAQRAAPPPKVEEAKQEEDSWEDKEDVTQALQDEKLRAELEKIALEEGKTVEELLKEEEPQPEPVKKKSTPPPVQKKETKSSAVDPADGDEQLTVKEVEEDTREHLNVIFIGHVGRVETWTRSNFLRRWQVDHLGPDPVGICVVCCVDCFSGCRQVW